MPTLMERGWRGPQTGRPFILFATPMQTVVRTVQPALAAGAAAAAAAAATVRWRDSPRLAVSGDSGDSGSMSAAAASRGGGGGAMGDEAGHPSWFTE